MKTPSANTQQRVSRRAILITAFTIAVILTVVGLHYVWNRKWTPSIRYALWFPIPYFLGLNQSPGMFLSLIHFPMLAWIFALVTRIYRARWVLAAFVVAYAVYAAVMIARLGPLE